MPKGTIAAIAAVLILLGGMLAHFAQTTDGIHIEAVPFSGPHRSPWQQQARSRAARLLATSCSAEHAHRTGAVRCRPSASVSLAPRPFLRALSGLLPVHAGEVRFIPRPTRVERRARPGSEPERQP